METDKFFKKKWSKKMVCSMCGSNNFKSIGIFENVFLGRKISIDFSLHCQNDHVMHFKEYIKESLSKRNIDEKMD
jgi:hypothetical protein